MRINGFNFSPGNSKLGKIWNFSLPPIKSCPKGVPCANSKGCYAHKAYRLYKLTRKAWDENLDLIRQDPKCYTRFYFAVRELVSRVNPKFFRIHVAGDFLDQTHLNTWKNLARNCPATFFLAFTKNSALDYSNLPGNLSIKFSHWPGWAPPNPWPDCSATALQNAWMDDGSTNIFTPIRHIKTRVLQIKKCPGGCATCKYCWSNHGDVVFTKH